MERGTVGDLVGRTPLPHLCPQLHLERRQMVTRLAHRLGEARSDISLSASLSALLARPEAEEGASG